MCSAADTTDLLDLQEMQGTTGGKQLAPDDLLALRTFFLLLDEWDRNSRLAASVDTQTESEQGERHARSASARKQRAA